jgi:hypothetical protein
MRILNILTIQKNIPTDIQSFPVESSQIFEGIYDMAIREGVEIIKNLLEDKSLIDEDDFYQTGVFISKDFEVHLMISYI